MFFVNKSYICLNFNKFILNQKIKLNTISKRVFSSKNHLKTISVSNCLPQKSIRFRCLSTKTTIKQFNDESKRQPKSHTTPANRLAEVVPKEVDVKQNKPTVRPIGIVGIHNWDDLKNIKEWICVYHFPYIVFLRTFQRMKLLLTVINVVSVPASIYFYTSGTLPLDGVAFYSMVGLFSMFALYIFGHLFSRFVGRIYISDDGKYVRLSHLSFFGNRIDLDIDSEDVVPLVMTNFKLNDWYCAIERYSKSNLLYMSLKFGGITDRKAFEQVFGEDSTKFLTK